MNYFVGSEEKGLSLLTFLKQKSEGAYSTKKLKQAIDAKKCSVNGRVVFFSSFLLAEGDRVEVDEAFFQEQKVNLSLPVLFEDPFFVIVNKPAGFICSPGSLPSGWQLAHRLDKETTGVLLLVKTEEAKQAAFHLFSQRKVEKLYLAIVDGRVDVLEGTVDDFLGKKGGFQGQTLYGSVSPKKGMRAITKWQCIDRGKESSLLLCHLETGRTHQIRVHVSEMGHPILGDHQYAKGRFCSSLRPKRILLHAWKISLIHPFTGKKLLVQAPLPQDFQEALFSARLQMKS